MTARANRGEFIFESERVKELFLRVVKRAKAKFSFVLRNFCIMGNHIHLMLRPTGGASLSRIMQWVLSVFARSEAAPAIVEAGLMLPILLPA